MQYLYPPSCVSVFRNATLILLLLFLHFSAKAQSSTTVKSGSWDDPSVWSTTAVPTSANGSVTILTEHTIDIPADHRVSIDQLIVNGNLQVNTDATLTIMNGVGTDLTVGGKLSVAGTMILNDSASHNGLTKTNTFFEVGSTYRHRYTMLEGLIPLATWSPASSVVIEGYTSFANALYANWNQSFGTVLWNCSDQTNRFKLNGLLQSIGGSFKIQNTGTGMLELAYNQTYNLTVHDDLEISNDATACFSSGPTTGSVELVKITIGGDFKYNSTNPSGSILNERKQTLMTINGNFSMNAAGGKLITSLKSDNTLTGYGSSLTIKGNFELLAGEVFTQNTAEKLGYFYFAGGDNTTHTFFNAGNISGSVLYSVAKNNTLRVIGESALSGGSSSGFTLGDQSGGAILIVESLDSSGAIQTGLTKGNLRVGNSTQRVFNSNSVIIYNGSGAQVIGNGQPGTGNAGTTSKLLSTIIDNQNGMSLNSTTTSAVAIDGNLTIKAGDLFVSKNSLTVNGDINLTGGNININTTDTEVGARTISANGLLNLAGGTVAMESGSANGDNTTLAINGDIIGTRYLTFKGINCRVTIGGALPTTFSREFPVSSAIQLEQLTINRESATLIMPQPLTVGSASNASSGLTLTKGNLVMKGDLVIESNLKLTSGTLHFEDHNLEVKRAITCVEQANQTPSGLLSCNAKSKLRITGTYSNMSSENNLAFSATGNILGSLTLSRSSLPTLPHITIKTALIIQDTLNLDQGKLLNQNAISLSSGALLIRTTTASLFDNSSAILGGAYHLLYKNGKTTSNVTTGKEATGLINTITSNCSDTVSLGTNLKANSIIVNQGTWLSNHQVITTADITNSAIFVAPDTLHLKGTLINNGRFIHNDGVVDFTGNSSLTSNPFPFNTIIINGTLNGDDLELQGDFINNKTFNHKNGRVIFSGKRTQKIMGIALNEFMNIQVTNSAAVPALQIESPTTLAGTLTLSQNVIIDADGASNKAVLTLLSQNDNPAVDASIAELPNGASITGALTVQRYISGEGRIYRYLTSPVKNATISEWIDDFPITGKFINPSTSAQWPSLCDQALVSTNASLFYYDEPTASYVAYPLQGKTASESKLEVGRGYTPFFRQCKEAIIVDVTGEVNQGEIVFPLTTASTNQLYKGWNLIGNPYPSAIHWNDNDWIKTNISETIAIRDNGIGRFKYWDGTGIPNDIPDGIIAMGQAFWVRATGENPKLVAHEGVKSNDRAIYMREKQLQTLSISLRHDSISDEAYLKVREGSEQGLDNYDAIKMNNAQFDIATLSNDKHALAINAIPDSISNRPFQLKMNDVTPGHYTLQFHPSNMNNSYNVRLIDTFLNNEQIQSEEAEFHFEITSDTLSSNPFRFSFVLEKEKVITGTATKPISAKLYPNPARNEIFIESDNDISIIHVWSSAGVEEKPFFEKRGRISKIDTSLWQSGMYLIQVISSEGSRVWKVFIE